MNTIIYIFEHLYRIYGHNKCDFYCKKTYKEESIFIQRRRFKENLHSSIEFANDI